MCFTFKGGGKSISNNIQEGIKKYLHENSSPASNRLIQKKIRRGDLNEKRYIPARYLADSMTQLFKESPYTQIISKSTFFKYAQIDHEFKKAHR
jgi:hypothetical protein